MCRKRARHSGRFPHEERNGVNTTFRTISGRTRESDGNANSWDEERTIFKPILGTRNSRHTTKCFRARNFKFDEILSSKRRNSCELRRARNHLRNHMQRNIRGTWSSRAIPHSQVTGQISLGRRFQDQEDWISTHRSSSPDLLNIIIRVRTTFSP